MGSWKRAQRLVKVLNECLPVFLLVVVLDAWDTVKTKYGKIFHSALGDIVLRDTVLWRQRGEWLTLSSG